MSLPRKLLIANRGEIACRIMRTAKRLGIATIAVYSEADRTAQHVLLADQAEYIGPAEARQSYLNIEALLEAAARSGADAIHPGYGFLSENAAFAEACKTAGLLFVGPPASAIRAMGSKAESKRVLESAEVPLAPGYHGTDQNADFLQQQAERIGYPLLIKASAGGGGKGIRKIERREEFLAGLAACQRESQASFDDARVILEKFITKPRHIEIQIFADQHGDAIYLGERDCSIQRRHQKVLEEAPAPHMTAARRRAMGEAAVSVAAQVGYVGAGTVEFIVAPDDTFYFMEMNTRLQVEHPVTEMITGLDLVEWQLRIAAGERLPLHQQDVQLRGHAVEVRLYAEDPEHAFLPSPGKLLHWQPPAAPRRISEALSLATDRRVDSGITSGDVITPFYDAMIAKLIAYGATREDALDTLADMLRQTFIVGPRNNLNFLARLVDLPAVRSAELDTGLIEREQPNLVGQSPCIGESLWLAALAALLLRESTRGNPQSSSTYPTIGTPAMVSPWSAQDGFRLVGTYLRRLVLASQNERCEVSVQYHADAWSVTLNRCVRLRARHSDNHELLLWIDDTLHEAHVFYEDDTVHVRTRGQQAAVRILEVSASAKSKEKPDDGLRSPLPGKVVAVYVKPGQLVSRGAPLVSLEAMKMEHTLTAPAEGTIETVHVREGQQIGAGVPLLELRMS